MCKVRWSNSNSSTSCSTSPLPAGACGNIQCLSGYSLSSGNTCVTHQCVPNSTVTLSCSVNLGTGTQQKYCGQDGLSSSLSLCTATSCNGGAFLKDGQCFSFQEETKNEIISPQHVTWNDTGVLITSNTAELNITVSGDVSYAPAAFFNKLPNLPKKSTADGVSVQSFNHCKLAAGTEFKSVAVLGRIGTNAPFLVGTSLSAAVKDQIKGQVGKLQFIVNDIKCTEGNQDWFYANIQTKSRF